MDCEKKLLYRALTAAQFSLFNLVPPSLRALEVRLTESRIDLLFYCHGELSEQEKEMITIDIDGEFSDRLDIAGASLIIRLDEPELIPKDGYLAYKRYEPGNFDRNDYLFPENFNEDLTKIYGFLLRPRILIAAQKALLNRVGENLRDVNMAWDDKNIWLYFYYDGQITELNKQLAKVAADEFISYFSSHELHFKILPSSESKKFLNFYNILPPENLSAVFSR